MKRYRKVLAALAISMCVMSTATMTSYAYTPEEIAAAKAWLSSNGYSPDMGGAQQAYQDYLDGKFGDQVPGGVNESIPIPEPGGDSQSPAGDGEVKPPDETFVVIDDSDMGETLLVKNPDGTGSADEPGSTGGKTDKSTDGGSAANADKNEGADSGSKEGDTSSAAESGNAAGAKQNTGESAATNFNSQLTGNVLVADKKQQMQKGAVIWNKMMQRSWSFVISQNLWGMSAQDFVKFMGVSARLEKVSENDSTVLYESYNAARDALYYFQFDKMNGLQAMQYTMFCKDAEELEAVKTATRQECLAALEEKSRTTDNNGLLAAMPERPVLRSFPSMFEGRYQSEYVFHCYIKG
ncbi:hypothetical protein [Hespellia stercorisuis]|uniref:Uncharacterized protein n=1 Tax=Hespellia stercorisuis DSM 15480 TaxID=1121950 RepID=A0A1M6S855_9FIRM|nr:hypothetical protein [Hespellia stercorisuis]SHK40984.1 hypothetical protein SAMN02745243_02880 [Hespellia stercorisuis DSM 15480]